MWILAALASYFLFALVALLDKYLLSGPIASAKAYAFFIGVLGAVLALLLLPLKLVALPESIIILFGGVAGSLRVLALLAFFAALKQFDASRIVPAVGAFLPVLTLVFVTLVDGQGGLETLDLLAFVLLVGGGVGVSLNRNKLATLPAIGLSLVAAVLFALSFLFSKFVYDAHAFWSGFFWILQGGLVAALILLVFPDTRRGIEEMLHPTKKKEGSFFTMVVFVVNQGMGGLAFVLQNVAIALVPLALLPFVNALEGTKFVFVLAIAVIISLRFPRIIKEEVSQRVLLQKSASIAAIIAGLALLAV